MGRVGHHLQLFAHDLPSDEIRLVHRQRQQTQIDRAARVIV